MCLLIPQFPYLIIYLFIIYVYMPRRRDKNVHCSFYQLHCTISVLYTPRSTLTVEMDKFYLKIIIAWCASNKILSESNATAFLISDDVIKWSSYVLHVTLFELKMSEQRVIMLFRWYNDTSIIYCNWFHYYGCWCHIAQIKVVLCQWLHHSNSNSKHYKNSSDHLKVQNW